MNLMMSLPGAPSLDYVEAFTVLTLCQYNWFLFVKLFLGFIYVSCSVFIVVS